MLLLVLKLVLNLVHVYSKFIRATAVHVDTSSAEDPEIPRYASPNRFELVLPNDSKAHPIFHINRLKAYTDPDMLKFKGTRKALP
eukprot:SAG11_NODE_631_length_8061_cov_13.466843_3_plen_84_part_01